MIPPTMIYVWESIPIDSLCSIHNFIRLNHGDFVIHCSKLHSFIEQSDCSLLNRMFRLQVSSLHYH